jgi:hypothetical protein
MRDELAMWEDDGGAIASSASSKASSASASSAAIAPAGVTHEPGNLPMTSHPAGLNSAVGTTSNTKE